MKGSKSTRFGDEELDRTLGPLYNNPAGYAGAAGLARLEHRRRSGITFA